MQHTYHIHIKGLVQGVGFRPFVSKLAEQWNIAGWVNNSNDGVHIEFTAEERNAAHFYQQIITNPPKNAVITQHQINIIPSKKMVGFTIQQSNHQPLPDIIIAPDIAICEVCKSEINDAHNKRYGYAFTTCLNCGPRFSISQALPYDRVNTTMADLPICDECMAEYQDVHNKRHYSQTNSCKKCAIPLHLFHANDKEWAGTDERKILEVVHALLNGKIVAVKGMGGFLLMGDATNEKTISTLRSRKHRPSKPLALLYPHLEMAAGDVYLRSCEIAALKSNAAPIVLCTARKISRNNICTAAITHGLDKMGLMLPCTALLSLIAEKVARPLVATSGNMSGSPIIFKDADALENLWEVADMILTYDREIVTPQDDSVMQFTRYEQKIIVRRSRGLAPNYFPHPFVNMEETILATGSELKSAFALATNNNVYISQFLGDQGVLESQEAYLQTLQYFTQLLQATPQKILVDLHPAYSVAQFGKSLSAKNNETAVVEVQHHKAHFAAVLAEHHLLHAKHPVMGIIWDGTGYGEDQQMWGSEIFTYHQWSMQRVAHLQYFPQLVGDKMSKEPRLSALSLLKNFTVHQSIIQKYFSPLEWQYYQKLIHQPAQVYTSSMGRFLDGIACILGIRIYNAYEGEAAMHLEVCARKAIPANTQFYELPLLDGCLYWPVFIEQLLDDLQQKKDIGDLSYKVFYSLAKAIANISNTFGIHDLAFSGGVFQNALLTDLIIAEMRSSKRLYFHQQLSANDECIGFGQVACYAIDQLQQQFNKRELTPFVIKN